MDAAKNRRKILVIFIDSLDTPNAAEQGALESAMKQDIPIYFMFMKNDFFRFSGKPTTAEDIGAYPASWLNIFEDVANYTGGRLINAEPMGNLNDEAVKRLTNSRANMFSVLLQVPMQRLPNGAT